MLYGICTQWLTLSCSFFAIIYCTELLQVVTLGGLVAGSLAYGLWLTVAEWLSLLLKPLQGIALFFAAVILGLRGLVGIFPGYSMEMSWQLQLMLLGYGILALMLGNFIRMRIE